MYALVFLAVVISFVYCKHDNQIPWITVGSNFPWTKKNPCNHGDKRVKKLMDEWVTSQISPYSSTVKANDSCSFQNRMQISFNARPRGREKHKKFLNRLLQPGEETDLDLVECKWQTRKCYEADSEGRKKKKTRKCFQNNQVECSENDGSRK